MSNLKLLDINLKKFDGGASTGAVGGEGTASASEGTSATTQAETTRKNGSSHRSSKAGEFSNVVYGKQEAHTATDSAAESRNADVSTTSDTLEAKRAAFEDLISGEYKDMFTERTQSIIDRRFKETKTMEAQLNSQKPVIEALMNKYKITDGDISKLTKAIDDDDAYWAEDAEEAGLTVEQYKQVQKLKRENEQMRQMQAAQQSQAQANAQINVWLNQAKEVKAIYPNFDFKQEVANPEFVKMLRTGVPVQRAYEVMHIDEMVNGAAMSAAQKAEKNTVAKLRNKSARPSENGTSSSSSAIIKNDVSSLTKADRAEIARRVARGEMISF